MFDENGHDKRMPSLCSIVFDLTTCVSESTSRSLHEDHQSRGIDYSHPPSRDTHPHGDTVELNFDIPRPYVQQSL